MSEQKYYERRKEQIIKRVVVERVRAYHEAGAKIDFEQGRFSRIVEDNIVEDRGYENITEKK